MTAISNHICPTCQNDERIHYYGSCDPWVLIVRCGACDWRDKIITPRESFRQMLRRWFSGGMFH